MVRPSLLIAGAAFALGVAAQQTSSYTDSASGITFQRYSSADGVYSFGIALPTDVTTDFIGQISASITEGYAAIDLGAEMTGPLLIAAWPNGDDVVGSIRVASGYANPSEYSNSSVTLKTISTGTSVNSTGFIYTFVCSGCITGDSLSFTSSATEAVFGWAYSTTALSDTTSSSATLNYHSAGFGEFSADLSSAQSSSYSTWAATASSSISTSTTGSNSTTTGSSSTSYTTTVSNSTYDYIIAGAGAAGLIVAERLAESGASVLLIERGGASTYSTGGNVTMSWNDTVTQYDVPAMAYYLSTASDTSEYCTDTASMAGCLLGGSTMVNAMMFVRPQEADFDDKWPTGWKWSDVESSANALYERVPGTTLASKDDQRYDQGAYTVLSQFLSANGFNSVDAIEEPNKKDSVYSYPPWMITDGLRGGPIRGYLPLAQAMSNFKLMLNTNVVRAVRNSSLISGIEIDTGSNTRQIININDGGKVILAAGTLSTPRILFNSGIGPKAQIETVQNGTTGVTLPPSSTWIELPVGENLMDHPIFTVSLTTTSSLYALPSTSFTSPNATDVDLFAQGSGLLAQSGQRLNFWTTTTATSDNATRYIQGTCNSPSNNTVKVKVYLTHGLTSSGVLEIDSSGSTTITTQPYLTTDGDKEAILNFMNRLIGYASQSNSTLTIAANTTAEDLIASYVTGDHFVGTARMGSSNDGTSVVDTNTKVWGTDNLYVVDASIHPDLPTGNTQAIVMVAAEKAASLILSFSGTSSNMTTSASSSSSASGSTVTSGAATNSTTSSGSSKCRRKRRIVYKYVEASS